jgi:hypothetical protein
MIHVIGTTEKCRDHVIAEIFRKSYNPAGADRLQWGRDHVIAEMGSRLLRFAWVIALVACFNGAAIM